jgi:hypothetical protein
VAFNVVAVFEGDRKAMERADCLPGLGEMRIESLPTGDGLGEEDFGETVGELVCYGSSFAKGVTSSVLVIFPFGTS